MRPRRSGPGSDRSRTSCDSTSARCRHVSSGSARCRPRTCLRIVDFFGVVQWPAVKFLGLANNHGIHHRGQLTAYLRGLGSKVPAMYGGSADEPFTR